jgi:hypothetical protein
LEYEYKSGLDFVFESIYDVYVSIINLLYNESYLIWLTDWEVVINKINI